MWCLSTLKMKGQRERERGRERESERRDNKRKTTSEIMCSRAPSAFATWPEVSPTKHSLSACLSVCLYEKERERGKETGNAGERERKRWRTSISWSRSVSQSHAWSPSALWAPGCWCWHLLLGHPHTCTYTRNSAHAFTLTSLKGIIATYI